MPYCRTLLTWNNLVINYNLSQGYRLCSRQVKVRHTHKFTSCNVVSKGRQWLHSQNDSQLFLSKVREQKMTFNNCLTSSWHSGRRAWAVKGSLVNTYFHLPNWDFPLSGSHKAFHFSYIKFLCLLKFLFVKSKSLQFLRKKKFRTGRVGFDLGASALQSITFTPTPPRICWQCIATTLTLTLNPNLTLTLCTNH